MPTKLYDLGARGRVRPLIGTIPSKVEVHDVIKAGNQTYVVIKADKLHDIAGVIARNVSEHAVPIYAEKHIVCPFCRGEHEYYDYTDEAAEIECRICGAKFEYERILTVEHTTKGIKAPTIIKTTITTEDGKVLT